MHFAPPPPKKIWHCRCSFIYQVKNCKAHLANMLKQGGSGKSPGLNDVWSTVRRGIGVVPSSLCFFKTLQVSLPEQCIWLLTAFQHKQPSSYFQILKWFHPSPCFFKFWIHKCTVYIIDLYFSICILNPACIQKITCTFSIIFMILGCLILQG